VKSTSSTETLLRQGLKQAAVPIKTVPPYGLAMPAPGGPNPFAQDSFKLRDITAAADTPFRRRLKAAILLFAEEGLSNREIAKKLRTTRTTVSRCRKSFLAFGLQALFRRAPRGPNHWKVSPNLRRRVIETTLRERERRMKRTKNGSQFKFSTRSLARRFGVSHMTIARIWHDSGLDPRSVASRGRMVRTDCIYIVGLSPLGALAIGWSKHSKRELVLARKKLTRFKSKIDELLDLNFQAFGGQLQAPLKKFREFYRFLSRLERQAHPDLVLHVLCDPQLKAYPVSVRRLLQRRGRLYLHFASQEERWYDYIYRWLSKLRDERFWLRDPYALSCWVRVNLGSSGMSAFYSVL